MTPAAVQQPWRAPLPLAALPLLPFLPLFLLHWENPEHKLGIVWAPPKEIWAPPALGEPALPRGGGRGGGNLPHFMPVCQGANLIAKERN